MEAIRIMRRIPIQTQFARAVVRPNHACAQRVHGVASGSVWHSDCSEPSECARTRRATQPVDHGGAHAP